MKRIFDIKSSCMETRFIDGNSLAVYVTPAVLSDDGFCIQYDFEILLNGAAATEPQLHAALLRPVHTSVLRDEIVRIFESELEWSGCFDENSVRVSFVDSNKNEPQKSLLRFSCAVFGAEKCQNEGYVKIRTYITETVWRWLGL